MTHRNMPTPTYGRPGVRPLRLEGLDVMERRKAVSTLAQIVTQAAGFMVEELSDEPH